MILNYATCGMLVMFPVARASCCLAQTPSTLSSPGVHHASRSSNGNSTKQKKEKESPPASDAARDVARRLRVAVAAGAGKSKRRVPVTVYVNDVSFLSFHHTNCSDPDLA